MFRIASKKIAIGLTLLAGALLVASSLGCGDTTAFPPASYTHPYSTVTWSADGSQIVFSRNVEGTYVVDAGRDPFAHYSRQCTNWRRRKSRQCRSITIT